MACVFIRSFLSSLQVLITNRKCGSLCKVLLIADRIAQESERRRKWLENNEIWGSAFPWSILFSLNGVIWIYIYNPMIDHISFKHFKFVYLCVKIRRKERVKLKRFTLVCCPQWLRWGWLCSQHIWPTPYHTPHKCAQTWIFVHRKFIAIIFTYLHIEFLDDFINPKTIFGIKIPNISPKSPNDFVWEVRCANLNIVNFDHPMTSI